MDQFFILTGGPGSGKSTIINELENRGIFCIKEVARSIIQEEMAKGGHANPKENICLRIEKMITRSIETYEEALNRKEQFIVFDRSVLDYIGYANRTGILIKEN